MFLCMHYTASFKYSMIKKQHFTIQCKTIYRLHKYSMSKSTSQQEVLITFFFTHFYITVKVMGKNETEQ